MMKSRTGTTVITLSRTTLMVGVVTGGKNPTLKEKTEADWTPENIGSVLTEIKEHYPSRSGTYPS